MLLDANRLVIFEFHFHYLVKIVGIICGFQLLVCSPDMYELIVTDDLSAMVGIEGRYILMKRDHGLGDYITSQIDPSMNFALNTYELVGSLLGGNNNF